MNVTPHVAAKVTGSAIDGRTTRHEGYAVSQRIRKRIEEVFHSLVDLQAAINRFIAEHNRHPKPFIWKADPDKIIAARNRGFQTLKSIH